MNNPNKPQRLFGFGRISKAPVVQDAADLGTAFGMEVTLDQAELEPPSEGHPPNAKAGWIRRLAGNRDPK